jgi:hypothetical protein
VLAHLPAANAAQLTGKQFFPHLISEPFHHGLVVVFIAAAVMSVISAAASTVGRSTTHQPAVTPPADTPLPSSTLEVGTLRP